MKSRFWIAAAMIAALAAGCNKPSPDPKPTPTQPTDPVSPTDPTPETPEEKNYFKADIKDLYAFNAEGSGLDMYVSYKTDISGWTVTPSESWCKINVEKESFSFILEEYKPTLKPDGEGGWLYTEPRSCTVQLTAGSSFSKTFRIVQESMTMISIPMQPVVLSADGASTDVLVRNNCYGWTATTDASWLTLKKKDSSTLTVKSSARPASETTPRTAEVTIVSDLDDWVNVTFTVTDADSGISGEDYNYGDHTEWD